MVFSVFSANAAMSLSPTAAASLNKVTAASCAAIICLRVLGVELAWRFGAHGMHHRPVLVIEISGDFEILAFRQCRELRVRLGVIRHHARGELLHLGILGTGLRERAELDFRQAVLRSLRHEHLCRAHGVESNPTPPPKRRT